MIYPDIWFKLISRNNIPIKFQILINTLDNCISNCPIPCYHMRCLTVLEFVMLGTRIKFSKCLISSLMIVYIETDLEL
jgi:hypothetical protein